MKRILGIAAGLTALTLAACTGTGNPLTGTGGGGGGTGGSTGGTIPASLTGSLSGSTYNGNTQTLRISLTGLDSPNLVANMVRTPALDVVSADGTTTYRAFTIQETLVNRQYLALFASGNYVSAGAVATEVQFSQHFGGAAYTRIGLLVPTPSGTARYIGGYTGIINLAPNATTDRAARVAGNAFISANFNEGLVEGSITNRSVVDATDATSFLNAAVLNDVSLHVTDIADNEFFGDVMMGATDVGDYGGIFGGPNAEEVAGVMVFSPFNDPTIMEYGVFVLPECASANASPSCP